MSPLRMLLAVPMLLSAGCEMSQYSTRPYEFSGVRVYQFYCSSCHGMRGHGDGPVAPLVHGMPDLTTISARNGGQFPRERIRRIIDGREEIAAHGTRQMPVWAYEFYGEGSNDRIARQQADTTVKRLTKYLETLQPGYDW